MTDDGDARDSVLNGLSVAGLTNDTTRRGPRTIVTAVVQSLAATAPLCNGMGYRFERANSTGDKINHSDRNRFTSQATRGTPVAEAVTDCPFCRSTKVTQSGKTVSTENYCAASSVVKCGIPLVTPPGGSAADDGRDAARRCRALECRVTANAESPERPPDPPCPSCGAPLVYVDTEISSGAFRPQAASMPQLAIHYYDCPACQTCWKLGNRLLPDPIRQLLR